MTPVNFLAYFLIAITSVCASNLPNIILILTDDQDMVLNSLDSLEKVQKLLINKGATFSSAVSIFDLFVFFCSNSLMVM